MVCTILANLLLTKAVSVGNDTNNHNRHAHKHVYSFEPAIVLSGVGTVLDIKQVAGTIMLSDIKFHVNVIVLLQMQHDITVIGTLKVLEDIIHKYLLHS